MRKLIRFVKVELKHDIQVSIPIGLHSILVGVIGVIIGISAVIWPSLIISAFIVELTIIANLALIALSIRTVFYGFDNRKIDRDQKEEQKKREKEEQERKEELVKKEKEELVRKKTFSQKVGLFFKK